MQFTRGKMCCHVQYAYTANESIKLSEKKSEDHPEKPVGMRKLSKIFT